MKKRHRVGCAVALSVISVTGLLLPAHGQTAKSKATHTARLKVANSQLQVERAQRAELMRKVAKLEENRSVLRRIVVEQNSQIWSLRAQLDTLNQQRGLSVVQESTAVTRIAPANGGPASQLPEQQVQKLNGDFFQTLNTRDLARFKQIVADEALFTANGLEVQTKEQVQSDLSNPAQVGIKNVRVTSTKVVDTTAVVVGRIWIRREELNKRYAFTNVFTKTTENGWKLIAATAQELR